MIVYSANFGGKDVLKNPLIDSSWNKDLKFFYFTDQKLNSSIWDIIVEKRPGNATRIARWYKMHSHYLFPGETTIWVDSNITIIKDPTKFCTSLLIQEHPYRFCLYEEADYCIRKKRGKREDIEKQIEFYRKQYYPEFYGLYTTRVIWRRPTEKMELLNKMWWEQIVEFSERDQISLPYVLWKYGISFNTIDDEELKACFYKKGGHKFRG